MRLFIAPVTNIFRVLSDAMMPVSMTLLQFVCIICCCKILRTETLGVSPEEDTTFLSSDDDGFDGISYASDVEKRSMHRYWYARATKRLHSLNEYQRFRNDYLKHILRVRVPGTAGHQHVRNFIKNTLEKFKWTVELDEFSTETPVGVRKFTNVIATLHPKADRVLALAAHYDSKDPKGMDLGEGEYFMGATDSAVPCAMLLNFAERLSEQLKNADGVKVSPMLIFLDGEEAFKEWTDTDSLYGSRHLAKQFASRPHHNKILADKDVTVLDSIEAFVLLDLIGTASPPPQFWDLYSATSKHYNHLQSVETQLKSSLSGRKMAYFPGKQPGSMEVEDDHKPFLLRGVPVLHLVPIPFPEAWHKVGDNEDSLDEETIVDLLKIFRQFLKEYFDAENP